jgi:hypothetical protein
MKAGTSQNKVNKNNIGGDCNPVHANVKFP